MPESRRRFSVQIEGSPDDYGNVRLTEFVNQLMALNAALQETQRLMGGPKRYYRIVDLHHDSPATVELEEVEEAIPAVTPPPKRRRGAPRVRPASAPRPAATPAVARNFVKHLQELNRAEPTAQEPQPPPVQDIQTLEAYRKVAGPLTRHVSRLVVKLDEDEVTLGRAFPEQLDRVIGRTVYSLGSITGTLKKVNLVGKYRFELFPVVGPFKVECRFRHSLLDRIREGLGKYVTVYGRLHYKQWNPLPFVIDEVADLDVHPSEATLPKLTDLFGIAPNATGGLTSADFLKKIREGDDE